MTSTVDLYIYSATITWRLPSMAERVRHYIYSATITWRLPSMAERVWHYIGRYNNAPT
jgi:hypothetical protein